MVIDPVTDSLPAPASRYCGVLFTDIVDSVGGKERLGEAVYAALKRRHNVLFQEIVAVQGGEIDYLEGDLFLAVLPDGRSALEAALRFQYALRHDAVLAGRLAVRSAAATERAQPVRCAIANGARAPVGPQLSG